MGNTASIVSAKQDESPSPVLFKERFEERRRKPRKSCEYQVLRRHSQCRVISESVEGIVEEYEEELKCGVVSFYSDHRIFRVPFHLYDIYKWRSIPNLFRLRVLFTLKMTLRGVEDVLVAKNLYPLDHPCLKKVDMCPESSLSYSQFLEREVLWSKCMIHKSSISLGGKFDVEELGSMIVDISTVINSLENGDCRMHPLKSLRSRIEKILCHRYTLSKKTKEASVPDMKRLRHLRFVEPVSPAWVEGPIRRICMVGERRKKKTTFLRDINSLLNVDPWEGSSCSCGCMERKKVRMKTRKTKKVGVWRVVLRRRGSGKVRRGTHYHDGSKNGSSKFVNPFAKLDVWSVLYKPAGTEGFVDVREGMKKMVYGGTAKIRRMKRRKRKNLKNRRRKNGRKRCTSLGYEGDFEESLFSGRNEAEVHVPGKRRKNRRKIRRMRRIRRRVKGRRNGKRRIRRNAVQIRRVKYGFSKQASKMKDDGREERKKDETMLPKKNGFLNNPRCVKVDVFLNKKKVETFNLPNDFWKGDSCMKTLQVITRERTICIGSLVGSFNILLRCENGDRVVLKDIESICDNSTVEVFFSTDGRLIGGVKEGNERDESRLRFGSIRRMGLHFYGPKEKNGNKYNPDRNSFLNWGGVISLYPRNLTDFKSEVFANEKFVDLMLHLKEYLDLDIPINVVLLPPSFFNDCVFREGKNRVSTPLRNEFFEWSINNFLRSDDEIWNNIHFAYIFGDGSHFYTRLFSCHREINENSFEISTRFYKMDTLNWSRKVIEEDKKIIFYFHRRFEEFKREGVSLKVCDVSPVILHVPTQVDCDCAFGSEYLLHRIIEILKKNNGFDFDHIQFLPPKNNYYKANRFNLLRLIFLVTQQMKKFYDDSPTNPLNKEHDQEDEDSMEEKSFSQVTASVDSLYGIKGYYQYLENFSNLDNLALSSMIEKMIYRTLGILGFSEEEVNLISRNPAQSFPNWYFRDGILSISEIALPPAESGSENSDVAIYGQYTFPPVFMYNPILDFLEFRIKDMEEPGAFRPPTFELVNLFRAYQKIRLRFGYSRLISFTDLEEILRDIIMRDSLHSFISNPQQIVKDHGMGIIDDIISVAIHDLYKENFLIGILSVPETDDGELLYEKLGSHYFGNRVTNFERPGLKFGNTDDEDELDDEVEGEGATSEEEQEEQQQEEEEEKKPIHEVYSGIVGNHIVGRNEISFRVNRFNEYLPFSHLKYRFRELYLNLCSTPEDDRVCLKLNDEDNDLFYKIILGKKTYKELITRVKDVFYPKNRIKQMKLSDYVGNRHMIIRSNEDVQRLENSDFVHITFESGQSENPFLKSVKSIVEEFTEKEKSEEELVQIIEEFDGDNLLKKDSEIEKKGSPDNPEIEKKGSPDNPEDVSISSSVLEADKNVPQLPQVVILDDSVEGGSPGGSSKILHKDDSSKKSDNHYHHSELEYFTLEEQKKKIHPSVYDEKRKGLLFEDFVRHTKKFKGKKRQQEFGWYDDRIVEILTYENKMGKKFDFEKEKTWTKDQIDNLKGKLASGLYRWSKEKNCVEINYGKSPFAKKVRTFEPRDLSEDEIDELMQEHPDEWDTSSLYDIKEEKVDKWLRLVHSDNHAECILRAHMHFKHARKNVLAMYLNDHFHWTGKRNQILHYINQCFTCKLYNFAFKNKRKRGRTLSTIVPKGVNQIYYIDLKFVQLDSDTGDYIQMNVVNMFTKRVFGKILRFKTEDEAIKAILAIFAEEGIVPKMVCFDNGKEFKNKVLKTIFERIGCIPHYGPSYSPWVQGAIEVVNKVLNKGIQHDMIDHQNFDQWIRRFYDVIKIMNEKPHTTIRMSADQAKQRTSLPSFTPSDTLEDKRKKIASVAFYKDEIARNIDNRGNQSRKYTEKLTGYTIDDDITEDDRTLCRAASRKQLRGKFDPMWCKICIPKIFSENRRSARVLWGATGGFLKEDKPFTMSKRFIHVERLKKYELGYGGCLLSYKYTVLKKGKALSKRVEVYQEFQYGEQQKTGKKRKRRDSIKKPKKKKRRKLIRPQKKKKEKPKKKKKVKPLLIRLTFDNPSHKKKMNKSGGKKIRKPSKKNMVRKTPKTTSNPVVPPPPPKSRSGKFSISQSEIGRKHINFPPMFPLKNNKNGADAVRERKRQILGEEKNYKFRDLMNVNFFARLNNRIINMSLENRLEEFGKKEIQEIIKVLRKKLSLTAPKTINLEFCINYLITSGTILKVDDDLFRVRLENMKYQTLEVKKRRKKKKKDKKRRKKKKKVGKRKRENEIIRETIEPPTKKSKKDNNKFLKLSKNEISHRMQLGSLKGSDDYMINTVQEYCCRNCLKRFVWNDNLIVCFLCYFVLHKDCGNFELDEAGYVKICNCGKCPESVKFYKGKKTTAVE